MSSLQISPVFSTPAAQVDHAATSVPRLLRAIARAARAFAADHRRPTARPATHEEVALHREARRQASLLRADTVRDGILLGRPL